MGHVNNRDGQLRFHLVELVPQVPPGEDVECGKGLIEQEQPGHARQGLAQGAALALPARHGIRFAASQMRNPETIQEHPRIVFLGAGGKGGVFKNGQMGEQGKILKDIAEPPLLRRQTKPPAGVQPDFVSEADEPFLGFVQPGDDAHQGGLSRPGGADDHGHPFRRTVNVEGQIEMGKPFPDPDLKIHEEPLRVKRWTISRKT